MIALQMSPGCGDRALRFVGDYVQFSLRPDRELPPGWRGILRTNIGRAALLREEIIKAHFEKVPLAGASWCDVAMRWQEGAWRIDLPLTETGFFKAKAYAVDPEGRQHWPDGPDFGVSVHPDDCRTGNIVYCAFTRLYGESRTLAKAIDRKIQTSLEPWDKLGYSVIPPSGKLRDLTRQLPHIFETLGCRVLHLLPINPAPTVFARFGRYGSPYACQDLKLVDPALVEFDKRTTGLDQFRELASGVHRYGGKLFLDLVINHTGWGAYLWETHPEWYRRQADGEFESPGAWGNIWRDLVELDQRFPALWDELAAVFLTWCRRGADGFRCDAGYKVPAHVWQYITARVREEYPDTVFLLEGLGGSWESTETLLTEGGMQWAYSELFQNYTGKEVAAYLDYSVRQSNRVGTYVHYSETHDNDRLAAKGKAWSLLRNRLCALTSNSGGFGFTGGVEWLAQEKINVHQCTGLAWDATDNLVKELTRLNQLLRDHPCFFDGTTLERLTPLDSPVLALLRTSAEGLDRVLVLVNTDPKARHSVSLPPGRLTPDDLGVDLLGQAPPKTAATAEGGLRLTLQAAEAFCLAKSAQPTGLHGDSYRIMRAQATWAMTAIRHYLPNEKIGPGDWRSLAKTVEASPEKFLAALPFLDPVLSAQNLEAALAQALKRERYPQVVIWSREDARRATPIPAGHWLLVLAESPFRARLKNDHGELSQNLKSILVSGHHLVAFSPRHDPGAAELTLELDGASHPDLQAAVRFLAPEPAPITGDLDTIKNPASPLDAPLVLLTNGIGGMARVCADLGQVKSKYDAVLAANLDPEFPVDRHVLVKRVRVWVNADGFITPLDAANLTSFQPGPPVRWRFVANAGDGRSVALELFMDMLPMRNVTRLVLARPAAPPEFGRGLPEECAVSLTVRFDIEDRNFHWETKRNGGADHHFSTHSRPLDDSSGFAFAPAPDRQLLIVASHGAYRHEPEWSHNLPHPVEASRGQEAAGDAYSPGWFHIPLAKGGHSVLLVSAESGFNREQAAMDFAAGFPPASSVSEESASAPGSPTRRKKSGRHHDQERRAAAMETAAESFSNQLLQATNAFVVRRGPGKTIIAGYPWFLDWGRDTLICARGLLAAGRVAEVREILQTFARFEQDGTLPNTIHGSDVSNRDTADAPLWFGLACEELSALEQKQEGAAARPKAAGFYPTKADDSGRTIADVLVSIAEGYLRGTANGIKVDPASALVFSPSHFTWMDTNYPACTPREGYPVEIQVLWIRLLRQLAKLEVNRKGTSYAELAAKAERCFQRFFWLEEAGWFADVLLAQKAAPARSAPQDHALRSNGLFAVSLGLANGERARRCVEAARRHLVVPGALRSLAPLPVTPPLPIHAADGRLLNNPLRPYCGRYAGDEDTQRKPAYHNGTAWTWTLPVFCEGLARAWDFAPEAVQAATSYLGGMARLMEKNCLGHIPEIVDGDAPHRQRGCDAQAWGATELLRVWKLLEEKRQIE